jgi:hypothetical protein
MGPLWLLDGEKAMRSGTPNPDCDLPIVGVALVMSLAGFQLVPSIVRHQ